MSRGGIYLNSIGKFDVPMPEPTPEKLAEEEVQSKKCACNRRKYERKKGREKLIEAGQMQPDEPYHLSCASYGKTFCGTPFTASRKDVKYYCDRCRAEGHSKKQKQRNAEKREASYSAEAKKRRKFVLERFAILWAALSRHEGGYKSMWTCDWEYQRQDVLKNCYKRKMAGRFYEKTTPSTRSFVRNTDVFSIRESGPRNTAITKNAVISAIGSSWNGGV